MADTRHKDTNWELTGTTHADVQCALLMDIRDELKLVTAEMRRMNSVIQCSNFIAIPEVLRRISRNTAKPRRKKK